MKRWMLGLALAALVLAAPAVAGAKAAHAHKVSGTVASIQGDTVTVKESDGKTVTVTLDSKTQYTRGKAATERSALRVGEHIVAHGTKEKDAIVATTIKISKSSKK
ncbi:MAG TPA: DUF5666 domain-containing protein [Vicinamibacterales bacterium]